MRHEIRFVTDDQMPEGQDFLLLACEDRVCLFYRESAVSPQVLEESWAAYRALERELLGV